MMKTNCKNVQSGKKSKSRRAKILAQWPQLWGENPTIRVVGSTPTSQAVSHHQPTSTQYGQNVCTSGKEVTCRVPLSNLITHTILDCRLNKCRETLQPCCVTRCKSSCALDSPVIFSNNASRTTFECWGIYFLTGKQPGVKLHGMILVT